MLNYSIWSPCFNVQSKIKFRLCERLYNACTEYDMPGLQFRHILSIKGILPSIMG